jgi:hypothetical protein
VPACEAPPESSSGGQACEAPPELRREGSLRATVPGPRSDRFGAGVAYSHVLLGNSRDPRLIGVLFATTREIYQEEEGDVLYDQICVVSR